jgi:hypothetical protein
MCIYIYKYIVHTYVNIFILICAYTQYQYILYPVSIIIMIVIFYYLILFLRWSMSCFRSVNLNRHRHCQLINTYIVLEILNWKRYWSIPLCWLHFMYICTYVYLVRKFNFRTAASVDWYRYLCAHMFKTDTVEM